MTRILFVFGMTALALAGVAPVQAADAQETTPIVYTCKGTVSHTPGGAWEFEVDFAPGPLVASSCIAENKDTANPDPPEINPNAPENVVFWANSAAPVGMAWGNIRGEGDVACGTGTVSKTAQSGGILNTGNFGSFSYWQITDFTATFTNGVGEITGEVERGFYAPGETRALSGTIVLDDSVATCNDSTGNALAVLVLE